MDKCTVLQSYTVITVFKWIIMIAIAQMVL
jgi:hypothetical protein